MDMLSLNSSTAHAEMLGILAEAFNIHMDQDFTLFSTLQAAFVVV